MNIDFGRPFTFLFEDQDWTKKLLMGFLYGLGSLLCYAGLIGLFGYQKRLLLATADGQDVPLPEFDPGQDFVEGLKVLVIVLGYYSPAIVLYLCGGLGGAILGGAAGDDDIGAIVTVGAYCFALPLFLAGQFLIPVGIIRFADQNSVGAAFQVGEVISTVRENFVNVLLVFVIKIATGMVAQFTVLLFCIGIFAGLAWAKMAEAHAYGQLLRIVRQKRVA